jgi:hypothetical protein
MDRVRHSLGIGQPPSGIGRLRGPLAITEFQEAKTVVHSIPPLQG